MRERHDSKAAAVVVGMLAAVVFCAALWLSGLTVRFFFSDQYAPFSGRAPFIAGGAMSILLSEGVGIFVPAVLLLWLLYFLAKFARNLWKG